MAGVFNLALLALGFGLLCQRRAGPLAGGVATQAAALALAAAWHGIATGSPWLLAVGLLIAGGHGYALARRLRTLDEPTPAAGPGMAGSLALGVGAVAVSALALRPAGTDALVVALALVLFGLLMLALRRRIDARLAGLAMLAHGVVWGALAAPPELAVMVTAGLLGLEGAVVLIAADDGVGRVRRR